MNFEWSFFFTDHRPTTIREIWEVSCHVLIYINTSQKTYKFPIVDFIKSEIPIFMEILEKQ